MSDHDPTLPPPPSRAAYDRLVSHDRRSAEWLSSPEGRIPTPAEQQEHFQRYEAELEELRRLVETEEG